MFHQSYLEVSKKLIAIKKNLLFNDKNQAKLIICCFKSDSSLVIRSFPRERVLIWIL